ncbi:response regulator [Myxococcus sp. Y35]|uniref:response regulator n=1 Tax=Pseudomyxococcus flavus TaxID=3115648 RepID=UPI003CF35F71
MIDMSPKKILLVDDELSVINALRRCLRNEGYDIVHANNPFEGLRLLRSGTIDLVISDHMMAGMTGLEFLKLARDRHPDCVRIILSGQADIQTAIDAINHGEIYRFFTKPWNDMELRVMLNLAFEQQRSERENRQLLAQARNRVLPTLPTMPSKPPRLPSIVRDAQGAILLTEEGDSEVAPA